MLPMFLDKEVLGKQGSGCLVPISSGMVTEKPGSKMEESSQPESEFVVHKVCRIGEKRQIFHL